jgi:hypothetical protein
VSVTFDLVAVFDLLCSLWAVDFHFDHDRLQLKSKGSYTAPDSKEETLTLRTKYGEYAYHEGGV